MPIDRAQIVQTRDGSWEVRWQETGAPERVRGFPTRAEARRFAVVDLGRSSVMNRALRQEASRWSLLKRGRRPVRHAVALGKTLEDARLARGLSLRDVSAWTGGELHASSLSLIERGKRTPTLTSLIAIAKALNLSIAQTPNGVTIKPFEEEQ